MCVHPRAHIPDPRKPVVATLVSGPWRWDRGAEQPEQNHSLLSAAPVERELKPSEGTVPVTSPNLLGQQRYPPSTPPSSPRGAGTPETLRDRTG